MTNEELDKLKYPIGNVDLNNVVYNLKDLNSQINTIAAFPEDARNLVNRLTKDQWQYKYRPEGWSIVQLINHCADSHMNAFIRFKLALTCINPTIIPYEENSWVNLPDTNLSSVENTLVLLEALQNKWVELMKGMTENQWNMTYYHPGNDFVFSLLAAVKLYDWHCKHHLEHIKLAIKSKGKYN
jgi:hypothetical protein